MTIYDRYAEVYDDTNQIAFSLKMIPYLDQVLGRHGVSVASALDLACGTGTVAISYASRGWETYALDASPAMLAMARRKANAIGVAVAFSQQDMRSFVVPGDLDLVTCFYDSLNYLLSPDDLRLVFGRVREALRPGGFFLFDVNTPWALEHGWDDTTLYLEYDKASVIMQSRYDKELARAEARIIGYVKRGELYERFEERHVEQGYDLAQIADVVQGCELELLAAYPCFTFDLATPTTARLFCVVRKPASADLSP